MKIAITKTVSKFSRYINWLEHFNVRYEIFDHSSAGDIEKLSECNGLLLTGGIDIYPELYDGQDTRKEKDSYDIKRDEFELKLLELAFKNEMPVLAICRGLQLVNVYFRGSLIFDLEEMRNVNHRKISDTEDRMHQVSIVPETLLREITGESKGDVTSSHHQSIDRLGDGLMINAESNDGIIEGIEFADKNNKSFMLGIQWHPERFKNYDSPFSKNILARFILECNHIKAV